MEKQMIDVNFPFVLFRMDQAMPMHMFNSNLQKNKIVGWATKST